MVIERAAERARARTLERHDVTARRRAPRLACAAGGGRAPLFSRLHVFQRMPSAGGHAAVSGVVGCRFSGVRRPAQGSACLTVGVSDEPEATLEEMEERSNASILSSASRWARVLSPRTRTVGGEALPEAGCIDIGLHIGLLERTGLQRLGRRGDAGGDGSENGGCIRSTSKEVDDHVHDEAGLWWQWCLSPVVVLPGICCTRRRSRRRVVLYLSKRRYA